MFLIFATVNWSLLLLVKSYWNFFFFSGFEKAQVGQQKNNYVINSELFFNMLGIIMLWQLKLQNFFFFFFKYIR